MATARQIQAARDNLEHAQAAAKRRRALGAPIARRTAEPAPVQRLEHRNPQQLYALAQRHRIEGRSAMGKSELIEAIRRVR